MACILAKDGIHRLRLVPSGLIPNDVLLIRIRRRKGPGCRREVSDLGVLETLAFAVSRRILDLQHRRNHLQALGSWAQSADTSSIDMRMLSRTQLHCLRRSYQKLRCAVGGSYPL